MLVCKSVCLPIRLLVCLSVRLPVCLPVCRSVCLSVCLSLCQSANLSVCLSAYLSVCLSVCLSVTLFFGRSVCLSLCDRLSVFLWEKEVNPKLTNFKVWCCRKVKIKLSESQLLTSGNLNEDVHRWSHYRQSNSACSSLQNVYSDTRYILTTHASLFTLQIHPWILWWT